MVAQRHFLGWHGGMLPRAVEFLFERYATAESVEWNMEQVIVVLPGRRAVRSLQELLWQCARRHQKALIPPTLATISLLPEQLYRAQRPLASELVQQVVWHHVLMELPEAMWRQLVVRRPDPRSPSAWQLADALRRLHQELAGDGYRFADVLCNWQQSGHAWPESVQTREQTRWQVLSYVQQKYLEQMDALGMWDPQTARLVAVEKQECQANRDIVLVGTVDINQTARRMLMQIGDRVTALVFAPSAYDSYFDEVGCLRAENWSRQLLEFADDQVEIVDGPAEQALRVTETLAHWSGHLAPHDVVIGVPDEMLVPFLQRYLSDAGVVARWGPGRPASESRVARLLHTVIAYIQRGGFAEFAALVRHPDVHDWLTRNLHTKKWLLECDLFYSERLPAQISPETWEGKPHYPHLQKVYEHVSAWVAPLTPQQLSPTQWSEAISKVLRTIYSDLSLNFHAAEHHEDLESFLVMRELLSELAAMPTSLLTEMTLEEVMALLSARWQDHRLAAPPVQNSVELVGWLDLPLDTAPAAIVTTFNEGFIPSSVNADIFLPNSLRVVLGLLDNLRRLARDIYAVRLLLESRQFVKFFVARRDALDNTLTVSRLALQAEPMRIAQRLRAFFQPVAGPNVPAVPSAAVSVSAATRKSRFVVRRPPTVSPPKRISVTALATYLTCPYRFYLEHVLQLSRCHDEHEELDAPSFGELLHAVFRALGTGPAASLTDPESLKDQLFGLLEEEVKERFGGLRLPAVEVQVGQAKRRLEAFAEWQANWAADGWQIRYVERMVEMPAHRISTLQHSELTLIGRIDRIDYHPQRKEWIVFDYKCGDTAIDPAKVHGVPKIVRESVEIEWQDLQLPVYRHLVRQIDEELQEAAVLHLGYITVPKKPEEVKHRLVNWDESILLAADNKLREILEAIERGVFWPPRQDVPAEWDEFAWICQQGTLEGPRWEG